MRRAKQYDPIIYENFNIKKRMIEKCNAIALENNNDNYIKTFITNSDFTKWDYNCLRISIYTCDCNLLLELIVNGIDIHKIYKNCTNCFMFAFIMLSFNDRNFIHKNIIKVIKLLLINGANVNSVDNTDYLKKNALIYLMYSNHNQVELFEIFDILIKYGVNINAQDFMGRTPLIHGVLNRRLRFIEKLLEYNPNINLVDKYGDNALSHASRFKILDILVTPIAKILYTNPNVCTIEQKPILKYIALNSNNSILIQQIICKLERKEFLMFLYAVKQQKLQNVLLNSKTQSFFNASSKPRINWFMHIESFLSDSIQKS